MLKDNFYNCHDMQDNGQEIICRIEFNADHGIFKGHFPDHPVVPGVCMMEIVKELVQSKVNKPLMLSTADNVKFLQLITPEIQPNIKISWKETEEGYSVNALFNTSTSVHFKLAAKYIISPFA